MGRAAVRTWRRWAAAAGAAAVISGCSGPPEPAPPSGTGIPASWVQRAGEGWSASDGFASTIPVLQRGPCLLAETPPELLDRTARMTDVGWGPFGDRSADETAFRYVCSFWAEDAYSGDLQLIKAPSAEQAQRTVDAFVDQPSTSQQENSVQTVRSGEREVQVLSRWYPTNPQGLYQAMYFDESAAAVAVLEINSLDESQYRQLSPQQVADALVATFAAA